MKKKINVHFISVAVIAILLSAVLFTWVSYTLLENEVMDDLKAYAHVLKCSGIFDEADSAQYYDENLQRRISVVDKNGVVVFDNKVSVSGLDNHSNRVEIKQARKKGEGQSIRHSDTLGKDTFYYTVLLDNGYVLRVAKEARSLGSVFVSSLPVIIAIIEILVILSVFLARFLTKSIVDPIEQMAQNIGDKDVICEYKELQPFVNMVQEHHDNIVKVADMRQEFTANISHELKTPLTSISGYAELIENGMATNEDINRFAGEIHQNANRLLTLINDIIRLSELDVLTEEVISFEKVDIYTQAQSCVDMLQINADRHEVSLELQGDPVEITANPEMINELLFNLCDNAIRYNNRGGKVVVSVFQRDNEVWLEVEDTGIGIPKEHQERIFERFYRVDKSRSKSTGGTGLGLAIVKHIIMQNHARLELQSEQGQGTKISAVFQKEY